MLWNISPLSVSLCAFLLFLQAVWQLTRITILQNGDRGRLVQSHTMNESVARASLEPKSPPGHGASSVHQPAQVLISSMQIVTNWKQALVLVYSSSENGALQCESFCYPADSNCLHILGAKFRWRYWCGRTHPHFHMKCWAPSVLTRCSWWTEINTYCLRMLGQATKKWISVGLCFF